MLRRRGRPTCAAILVALVATGCTHGKSQACADDSGPPHAASYAGPTLITWNSRGQGGSRQVVLGPNGASFEVEAVLAPRTKVSAAEFDVTGGPGSPAGVVRSLPMGGRWRPGRNVFDFRWDGKDSSGRSVTPGSYAVSTRAIVSYVEAVPCGDKGTVLHRITGTTVEGGGIAVVQVGA